MEVPAEIALKFNKLPSLIVADKTLVLVTLTLKWTLSSLVGKDLPRKSCILT